MSGNTRPHLVLIGMMGSGKSTVGRLLADALDWPFYDLDEQIEIQAHMTVGQIFQTYGEKTFRQWEIQTLALVLSYSPAIVLALGGGTLLDEQTHKMVNGHYIIWLDAPSKDLWLRVKDSARPLAQQGMEAFDRLHQERRATYEKLASVHITCVDEPDKVVEAIVQKIRSDGNA